MEKIDVSVIIPIYNAEKYLRETLESVIAQTFQNIEILCVDDGSTDKSVQIVQSFMKIDRRIKLLYQREESDNAARARNLGVEHARGTYLMFLDSDDLFDKNMIMEAYGKAVETNADMVIFDGYIYDTEREECLFTEMFFSKKDFVGKTEPITPRSIRDSLIQTVREPVWNKIYRKSYIDKYNIKFHPIRQCDDYAFVALAAMYAKTIAILDKRLIYYRRDMENSQTSNYFTNYSAVLTPSEKVYEELTRRGLYEEYKVSFLNKCVEKMKFYLDEMKSLDEYKKTFVYIKEHLNKMPFYNDLTEVTLRPTFGKFFQIFKKSNTPEEALFLLTRRADWYHRGEFKLPKNGTGGKTKVVLYGAGAAGKRIHRKIIAEKEVMLVAWLDRNYEQERESGVDMPKKIQTLQYDYVFIAIESTYVLDEVEKYLLDLGVEQGKIVRLLKE